MLSIFSILTLNDVNDPKADCVPHVVKMNKIENEYSTEPLRLIANTSTN